MPRQLLILEPADRVAFAEACRGLSQRVYENRQSGAPLAPGDPISGDPFSGRRWLENRGVTLDPLVTSGVSIYFQTVENPCIMIPPFELLKDPLPQYTAPAFYCDECAKAPNEKGDYEFYMRRFADYTLSHCGP